MSAAELLADFQRAGVVLFTVAGRLQFRAPVGTVTAAMREAATVHRGELLRLLDHSPPTAAAPEWDANRAAIVLADSETTIENALTHPDGLTALQRTVAEGLRSVVRVHAERHDPLLWNDLDFLTEQIAGWRRFNSPAPRRKTA
jgi:TubC N-terminal docking domain